MAGGATGERGAGRDDSRGAVSVVQTAVLETHARHEPVADATIVCIVTCPEGGFMASALNARTHT